MSERYRAERALSSGTLPTMWDVIDLDTGEYLPFVYRSTAEDVAEELNSGQVQRDQHNAWFKP